MSAVLTHRKVWTREETHLLADLGFPNAQRLELINGELIERVGKNPPHTYWSTILRSWLETLFGVEHVRVEAPIDVDDIISEPEPDLVVCRYSVRESSANPKPTDITLLIEVSDTTVSNDMHVKGPLYARAGIKEYWVVNVPSRELVIHLDPQDGTFQRKVPIAFDQPFQWREYTVRLDAL